MASLIGLIVLALAALYGGWEWVLITAIVLIALLPAQFHVVSILATVGASFFWLALFHWTGDRRLFFPYVMQLAVQMPYLLQGRSSMPAIVGGGGLIAGFMLIRVTQSATAGVLKVELFVATAILTLLTLLPGNIVQGPRMQVLAGVLGSILAFFGLTF